jgi:hypothetical protein
MNRLTNPFPPAHQKRMNIQQACEAANAHELLTQRVMRFLKAAKVKGMDIHLVTGDRHGINFQIDKTANLNKGISRYGVYIKPGSVKAPAVQLSKRGKDIGFFGVYYREKDWQYPNDAAFTELLEAIV